jgi:hypothetical protein
MRGEGGHYPGRSEHSCGDDWRFCVVDARLPGNESRS